MKRHSIIFLIFWSASQFVFADPSKELISELNRIRSSGNPIPNSIINQMVSNGPQLQRAPEFQEYLIKLIYGEVADMEFVASILQQIKDRPTSTSWRTPIFLGDKATLAALDRLRSGDVTFHGPSRAILSFSGGSEAIDAYLSNEFLSTDPLRRAVAIEGIGLLAERKNEGLLRILVRGIGDADAEVRLRSALALQKDFDLGSPWVIGPLQTALRDSEPKIRELAVILLGPLNQGDTTLTQELLMLVRDPNPFVSEAAIRAVSQRGFSSEEFHLTLIEILSRNVDESTNLLRVAAREALVEAARVDRVGESVVDRVLALSRNDNPLIRGDAFVFLMATTTKGKVRRDILARIIEGTKDKNWGHNNRVRLGAIVERMTDNDELRIALTSLVELRDANSEQVLIDRALGLLPSPKGECSWIKRVSPSFR